MQALVDRAFSRAYLAHGPAIAPGYRDIVAAARAAPDQTRTSDTHRPRPIQEATAPDDIREAAARGLTSPSSPLPHLDVIQKAFGPAHELGAVHAHLGDAAAAACGDLGANAYATGDHVVFSTAPDLRTAAHEAAHVVQQRAGVSLDGGVGEVGDPYERHADRVADRVVAGKPAADLMAGVAGRTSTGAVQFDRTGRRDETDREQERDRRDRRDPGGRGRGRRGLGDDFDSDWAGRAILDRYLDGGGDWDIIDDPGWTDYMKASDILRGELRAKVLSLVAGYSILRSDAVVPIELSFHAEVENGEGIIGYQYLHGTNKDVGDFQIRGTAKIHREHGHSELPTPQNEPPGVCEDPMVSEASPDDLAQVCSAEPAPSSAAPAPAPLEVPPTLTVELDVSFVWNDMIDPNGKYMTDKIKDAIAWLITLGGRSAYRIAIAWKEKIKIVFDEKGKMIEKTGYPFDP